MESASTKKKKVSKITGTQYASMIGANSIIEKVAEKKYKTETYTIKDWGRIFVKDKLIPDLPEISK